MNEPIAQIYEVIDRTDDEAYYTLGLFLSLDDAIKDAESKTPDDWESDGNIDDYAEIEIRERQIGWTGTNTKKVWEMSWKKTYPDNDEADDYIWEPVKD